MHFTRVFRASRKWFLSFLITSCFSLLFFGMLLTTSDIGSYPTPSPTRRPSPFPTPSPYMTPSSTPAVSPSPHVSPVNSPTPRPTRTPRSTPLPTPTADSSPISGPIYSPSPIPGGAGKSESPIVIIGFALSIISTLISVLGFVTSTSLNVLKELRDRRSAKLAEEKAERERIEWEIKHAEWLVKRNDGPEGTARDSTPDE
jgi:hypothetical protein